MQNQRKYFKLNLFFILIGIILIYILSFININYVNENNRFKKVQSNLKIINLGSSHGLYGIKYPAGLEAFNFALPSQPFYYDLRILKKNANKVQKNGIVIIPISIFSFYQENESKELEEISDTYYMFLEADEVYLGDRKKSFLIKYFSLLYNGRDVIPLTKYLLSSLKNRSFKPQTLKWPRNLSLDEKIKEAEITTERHLKTNDLKVYQPSDFSSSYLGKILKICKENNLKPVLITTPQSYLYNERTT